jgi:hypothetical protein
MAEEKEAKAKSDEGVVTLLKEIRELQQRSLDVQSRFLFMLLPIFVLLTIITILGLTGYFVE